MKNLNDFSRPAFATLQTKASKLRISRKKISKNSFRVEKSEFNPYVITILLVSSGKT